MTDSGGLRRRFAGRLALLAEMIRGTERRRSFRARAYGRAVWSLDHLQPDLSDSRERVLALPGLGPGTAALIDEFRREGQLSRLEEMLGHYPAGSAALRRLPRMTPRLLRSLKLELGVDDMAGLAAAVDAGAAESLPGVGPATAALWANVLACIPSENALPAHAAWVAATRLGGHLEKHLDAEAHVTGQVRRVEEWVDRIELVIPADDPRPGRRFLLATAVAGSAAGEGRRIDLRLHGGAKASVHLGDRKALGSLLLETTGPPGCFPVVPGAASEEEAFEAAGTQWVPPAARGAPPLVGGVTPVGASKLKGDLHLHSDWSQDGRMPLRQVFDLAQSRGYEYVLITDHTKGLRFGGLDEDALGRQSESIESLRSEYPELSIFHGAELNIGPDGELDIEEAGLELLDLAVAAVHSHFGLDEAAQSRRVLAAMSHPMVRVLAHPTGRRIGVRPPLSLDMDAIAEGAGRFGVALELNGHRDRLDLGRNWLAGL